MSRNELKHKLKTKYKQARFWSEQTAKFLNWQQHFSSHILFANLIAKIQWGSKYQKIRYLNSQKGVGHRMVIDPKI